MSTNNIIFVEKEEKYFPDTHFYLELRYYYEIIYYLLGLIFEII